MENNNEKKDVGIVGYWYATNYGSVITYYALSYALNKLGYSTLLIDCPEKEKDLEGEDVFPRIFLKKHLSISESVKWNELSKINDYANSFIVGSDQVWTAYATRAMRYMFHLAFVDDDKKKIAYGPSFGNDSLILTPEQFENVGKYLRRFNRISVREDVGIKLVDDLFGLKANRVLDPVFLMDLDEYDNIANESKMDLPEKYILAYILDPTPDKEKAILKTAKALDCKVKIILDGRKFTFEKNLAKLTLLSKEDVIPNVMEEDWIKAFKNSSYVVTDSHHGLAMAIIYNKPFICYANHSRGYARFTSLLNLLKLKNRLVEDSQEINSNFVSAKINFDLTNKIIESEKEKSLNWLKDALEDKPFYNTVSYNLDLKNKCTGCSACANVCPVNAITMGKNREGFLNPVIDLKKCINCGLCKNTCIVLSPEYKNNLNPECHAVCATDEIRELSSSGGVFSLAAKYIFEHEGYVCGAAFRPDFSVHHIIINSEKDMYLLRGSKYIQSEIEDCFIKIKDLLEKKQYVLFTGTPCQVAGLYKYLKKDYETLFTLDVLCRGVPSYKVFEKYWKDCLNGKDIKELSFRPKQPWGWYTGICATFDDGTKYQKKFEEDPYFLAHSFGLGENATCGTCLYNKLPRQGDLTIGDFWRINNYNKSLNDNKGTSVVLINNAKGKTLFENLGSQKIVDEIIPIEFAIAGNGSIIKPYGLHKNRKKFFDGLETIDFNKLVEECSEKKLNKDETNFADREMFYISKIVDDNKKSRKIVMYGHNQQLEGALKKYFNIDIEFYLTEDQNEVNNTTIKHFDSIAKKNNEYYLVMAKKQYNESDANKLSSWGYKEIADFVYRYIKPITLKNLDLSKQKYSDIYGNQITGAFGIIPEITLRGYNNNITFENNVWNLQNTKFDLSANTNIHINSNTNFTKENVTFETKCYDGYSKIEIGKNCIFMNNTRFICYLSKNGSNISIGNNSTFGKNVEFHSNMGKKIMIGNDCMFSSNIQLLAGDGHAIFDVKSGKVLNGYNEDSAKNLIKIGNHVWIGANAFLLNGTDIGDGCIIGACTFVKDNYPNNCSIAGNPSKIISKDIAWARDMWATNINACGGYSNMTDSSDDH